MSTVYLNGEYLPKEQATVSVDDRGFLLSDGLYEVTPAYRAVFSVWYSTWGACGTVSMR